MNDLIRDDGYVNITKLCQQGKKQYKHWNENKSTKKFLITLSNKLNIPQDTLIYSIMNGNNKLRGTWGHPMVATNIAQWISVEFSIGVSIWIEEWKQTKIENELKYNTSLINIVADNHKDTKEKEIQLRLQSEMGGQIEVETHHGYIDLLTDTELIEIKVGYNWKYGLGQLYVYSEDYPDHQRRLHLFDIESDESIEYICNKLNIIVTYEA